MTTERIPPPRTRSLHTRLVSYRDGHGDVGVTVIVDGQPIELHSSRDAWALHDLAVLADREVPGAAGGCGMSAGTVYREAERQHGLRLAGSLSHLLDDVAYDLHNNESLHLHDAGVPVGRCGYCYLRAGRTLGIVAQHLASPGGAS